MKLHRFLLSALLVTGFADPSPAAVLFSNLSQADNGTVGFSSVDERYASDFLTGGTPSTITSITANLGNSSLLTTINVTFSIFTDNGSGQPGILVGTFNAAPVPAGGSGTFTGTSSGINLDANAPYWVVSQVDSASVGGTLSWRFNQGQGTDGGPFSTVTGTQFLSSLDGGVSWTGTDSGNLIFALEGDITPVPEPTNYALAAFGLVFIGVGAGRFYRNRRLAAAS